MTQSLLKIKMAITRAQLINSSDKAPKKSRLRFPYWKSQAVIDDGYDISTNCEMDSNKFSEKWGSMNILLISLFLISFGISGCNNQSKSSPPPPSCPIGQAPTPAGCAIQGQIPQPIGYLPPNTTNGLTQYFASKADFVSRVDTLSMNSIYRDFLRDALQVCDRCYSTSSNAGLECGSWLQGFNMIMVSFSGQLNGGSQQLAFYSNPAISQSYYYYSWQFPKPEDFFISMFTGVPAPSCTQGSFSPYWATNASYDLHNNGNGFVVYAKGGPLLSKWNLYQFRLYVSNGKVGDNSLPFRVTIKSNASNASEVEMATGTLSRCQTPNCGMFY